MTYAVKAGHLSILYNTFGVGVQVIDTDIFTTCFILLILLPGFMFRVTQAPLRISSDYRYNKTVFTVRYWLRLKKQLSIEY
jgi:hypothetical protein